LLNRIVNILGIFLFISFTTSTGCLAQIAAGEPQPNSNVQKFTKIGDFSLGAASDRIDYQSLDPTTGRLYISQMGAGKLLVFDVAHEKLLAAIDGFPKTTGVLVVPDLHRVYSSVPGSGVIPNISVGLGMVGLSAGSGKIAIVDTRSLQRVASVTGGVFPDGIAYDPKERRIFVSDELGGAIFVIDADTNLVVARIAAGAMVGNVRYDPVTRRVYAPLGRANKLAVIDPVSATLIQRLPLPGAGHPHGFAIAPGTAIGYVACDGNDRLLAVNLVTGMVLANRPVAHDPDVLAIDSGAHRLYVASESGNISTYNISTVASPMSLGEVFVGDDAHSVAVDPNTHLLYLPLADIGAKAVMRVLQPQP
jgi:DNA-binding beta-propeller fold protein YncE